MPTITCNWCHYIAHGDGTDDKWRDIKRHEKTCKEKKRVERRRERLKKLSKEE